MREQAAKQCETRACCCEHAQQVAQAAASTRPAWPRRNSSSAARRADWNRRTIASDQQLDFRVRGSEAQLGRACRPRPPAELAGTRTDGASKGLRIQARRAIRAERLQNDAPAQWVPPASTPTAVRGLNRAAAPEAVAVQDGSQRLCRAGCSAELKRASADLRQVVLAGRRDSVRIQTNEDAIGRADPENPVPGASIEAEPAVPLHASAGGGRRADVLT